MELNALTAQIMTSLPPHTQNQFTPFIGIGSPLQDNYDVVWFDKLWGKDNLPLVVIVPHNGFDVILLTGDVFIRYCSTIWVGYPLYIFMNIFPQYQLINTVILTHINIDDKKGNKNDPTTPLNYQNGLVSKLWQSVQIL